MTRNLVSASLLIGLAVAALSSAAFGDDHRPPPGDRPPPREPPAEAIAACAKASDGATCSFQHDERKIEGTCRKPPEQTQLACMPADHRPPPRDGGRVAP